MLFILYNSYISNYAAYFRELKKTTSCVLSTTRYCSRQVELTYGIMVDKILLPMYEKCNPGSYKKSKHVLQFSQSKYLILFTYSILL